VPIRLHKRSYRRQSVTMHLLNLTLQPATAVSGATVGSFSGTKGQEILVVRGGTRLEMLKLNTASGHRESCSFIQGKAVAFQQRLRDL
jgi:hypothetical protein